MMLKYFAVLLVFIAFSEASASSGPVQNGEREEQNVESFKVALERIYSRSREEKFNPMPLIAQYENQIKALKAGAKLDKGQDILYNELFLSFMQKLMFNYNPEGIDYLKQNGPWDLSLTLAYNYFIRQYPFSHLSAPRDCLELNTAIAGIYLSVWNSAAQCLQECFAEINANVRGHKALNKLKLPSLTVTQRDLVFSGLAPAIASRKGVAANSVLVGQAQLSQFSIEDLEDIQTAFHYIVHPFTLPNLQQFAWCARHILKDETLCQKVFVFAQDYQDYLSLGGGRRIAPTSLEKWLEGVAPKEKFSLLDSVSLVNNNNAN